MSRNVEENLKMHISHPLLAVIKDMLYQVEQERVSTSSCKTSNKGFLKTGWECEYKIERRRSERERFLVSLISILSLCPGSCQ